MLSKYELRVGGWWIGEEAGRSFVISKYCAFLPFQRVKSIKGSYMAMWVIIFIIIPFEVKDINIFRVFLWGWRGKMRRRGLSPEGSPLCRALQGKYDDYILKTFKNPKSWFFMTWISWLVFIAWNLCFTVFWLVLMAPHFCEFGNYISRKNVSDIKKMQWRRFPH